MEWGANSGMGSKKWIGELKEEQRLFNFGDSFNELSN